jgi:type VI secretion system protein VasD
MPQWGYAVVGFLIVSLLNACGSAAPPLLQGTIKVDQAANPDLNGRASPVVVRVYELRSPGAFSAADFFSLFEKESETLAGDLVGREEYGLRPAETRPYRRQLQPDTKFIGVVAAFRDLEHARWRQVATVPAERESTIAIGIEARTVTVTVASGGGSFFTKLLPSKDSQLPSKGSLLGQANVLVTDLTSMMSGGKLTPQQTMRATQLLTKATALKGELGNLTSSDALKLPQLASDLVDLQEQVRALTQ